MTTSATDDDTRSSRRRDASAPMPAATPTVLLDAARAVFAEHGPDASLEEIARRAEVGIGTLYRHYPTRQALLEAVFRDDVESALRTGRRVAAVATRRSTRSPRGCTTNSNRRARAAGSRRR